MNRTLKKILKFSGITLLVLIILAFLIPIIFKKQITNLVKKEINNNLVAQVDFKDVSLSLFRRFPRVSITLDELQIVGLNEFAGDTLLYATKVDASANLMSVIKGDDIKVYGLFLDQPRIHALVNTDGHANWDIVKPSSDTTQSGDSTGSAFKLTLEKYSIRDGYIVYDDQPGATYLQLAGLNHEGSGDLTADIFTLSTKTGAAQANFSQDGIPYLVNATADIVADIKIDNTSNTYTFKTDDIRVNALKLSAEGFFQLANDSTYNMDIQFQSPSNEFKDILSLVPAVYQQDFEKIKTSGTAIFKGFVKGAYSPQQMPAYDIALAVKNGSFQYPDLPKPINNIQLDLHAMNSDGQPDNMVIDLSQGHLEMDNEPFDFRFLYRNPVSAPFVDAAAKGKLDLSQLTQFVKLDGNTRIAGLVNADAFVKGTMSAITTQTGSFTAGGFFDVTDLMYASNDFPQPVRNGNMKIQLENTGGIADNTAVEIREGHLEVGNDPIDFTLYLTKPVSLMQFAGTAKGSFTLDNIKQFTTLTPGTAISGKLGADLRFSGNKELIDQEAYDKINLAGTVNLDNVKYTDPDYPTGITVSTAAATFTPAHLQVNRLEGEYLGSNFTASGTLNNILGYAMKDEPLSGTLAAAVDQLNLNDWMGTPEAPPATATATPAPASTPFQVPANLAITLNAKAGKVTYDKVDYNNINGTVILKDETVRLQQVNAQALDGSITMNGSYSTLNNKVKPAIGITYSIKDMDVQKAFLSFNTVRALMPVGKFLAGKLNSELTMTGNLGSDMMPSLESLTGKGNLLLIEGVLAKFAPLEKLAAALQIDRLKSISVKDIKNYIEFANGKVLVQPFTIKLDDIEMQIGGMHGFDQSIDYIIGLKVPRKYLGTQGNNLVNGLVTSANNRGIPINLGETVDLNVKMGGTLTNPSIKYDLKQVAGDAISDLKEQAKDFAQAKVDSAKQRAKDTLASIKEQVKDQVKDKIRDQLFGKDTNRTTTDTTKKKGEAVKNRIKDLFNKPKKAADSTRQ